MKKIIVLAISLGIVLFMGTVKVWADDIEEEIKKGLSAYMNKNYTKAISSLQFAAQQIRQMKVGEIEKLFPEPLSGWKAQKAKSVAVGAMFFG